MLLLLPACGGGASREGAERAETPRPAPTAAEAPAAPAILFVGTSLTAGLGVAPDEAYPALVAERVAAAGLRFRVVNAGVSGETSAGARRRMDWLLRQPVALVVLETGANDGLRGQDPAFTRDNLQAILERVRSEEPAPELVLVGMEALPNYGEAYREAFRSIFPELAERNGLTLVPFLLEGVAAAPALNQADGIHPNAAGHAVMAETVWRQLEPILRRRAGSSR